MLSLLFIILMEAFFTLNHKIIDYDAYLKLEIETLAKVLYLDSFEVFIL